MDEDSVASVKDRLTISEVVEVLRDPSKYPVITNPPQRPKAVPNLHSSYVFTCSCCYVGLLFQETKDPNAGLSELHPVQLFCKLHFIPKIILFTVFLAICSCTQYSRLLSSSSRPGVMGKSVAELGG